MIIGPNKFSLQFQEDVVSFTSCPKLPCIVAPWTAASHQGVATVQPGEGEVWRATLLQGQLLWVGYTLGLQLSSCLDADV